MTTPPKLPNLRLLEPLGEGGMATVWKAVDLIRDRPVAVKLLNDGRELSEEEISAFRDEERIMSEIQHVGIVEAYYMNKANGIWYIVMELVDGYNFADYLRRKHHVSEADCLLICESVASALDYAWNEHGIVHCDIKPDNIMINTSGVVKITDLGISHRFDTTATGFHDASEHVLGTPAYISPEQVYGDVELDCRVDIYSLAATLYHLATGRILFPALTTEETMRAHCNDQTQANDPRTYRPNISEGFCQMLEAMLVKDREFRISSWATVFQMCQDIENGIVFKARPDSAPSSIRLMA